MPSSSSAQHRYMELLAHDPEKARDPKVRAHPAAARKLGREFVNADKREGKHFAGKAAARHHRLECPVEMVPSGGAPKIDKKRTPKSTFPIDIISLIRQTKSGDVVLDAIDAEFYSHLHSHAHKG